jgi:hypothetical protein
MRTGMKLVFTVIAAIVLHGLFYYILKAPSPMERTSYVSDAILGSVILNLMGIPIGIFLGNLDRNRSGGTWMGLRTIFFPVFTFWVIFFGPLTGLGLLIGKYTNEMIREWEELPPPVLALSRLSPPFPYPASGRTGDRKGKRS